MQQYDIVCPVLYGAHHVHMSVYPSTNFPHTGPWPRRHLQPLGCLCPVCPCIVLNLREAPRNAFSLTNQTRSALLWVALCSSPCLSAVTCRRRQMDGQISVSEKEMVCELVSGHGCPRCLIIICLRWRAWQLLFLSLIVTFSTSVYTVLYEMWGCFL